ncbi:hypothetical protein [Psychroserpens sp. SPM9]|uniref:hypothetical protein n=1 Tax=Psychroserpens sp. SPM9 TaxID=2975598 RepID=UPI0021A28A5C|nr:hypothetical protein [Psychroserpens sp. SPM9]MDG5493210.1 hypothetical protein [Psychroserpens sp. SPM9]
MDNGLLLIITFSTPLLLLIVYFIWLSKRKKRHAEALIPDWNKFEKALSNEHINGIIKYGTELVWNENLTDSQMKKMKESVYDLAEKHTELENLKNLIYNKWLDWDKDIVGTP